MFNTIAEAEAAVGGLSKPSKMPGYAYGLPVSKCQVGEKLMKLKNSTCSACYANKGRYRFNNVQIALHRRYFALLMEPRWVDAMVFLMHRKKIDYFRWHDSGDLQSTKHLEKIAEIARRCPDTKFWLPTREYGYVKAYTALHGAPPPNLTIRVSAAMIDAPPPNYPNTSTVTTGTPTCPAYTQGGACGPCRMCWDPTVPNVSYPKH